MSREMIWAPTAVPMLEPKTTPSDCTKVRTPALTIAITIIMVTDDDSRKVVATAPVNTAAKRLVVHLLRKLFMRSVPICSSPSDRRVTP